MGGGGKEGGRFAPGAGSQGEEGLVHAPPPHIGLQAYQTTAAHQNTE